MCGSMGRFRLLTISILCLALVLSLTGCTKKYQISGRVVRSDNGEAVAGVSIVASSGATTVSAADGSWSLSELKGTVSIHFSKDSWHFYPEPLEVSGSAANVTINGMHIVEQVSTQIGITGGTLAATQTLDAPEVIIPNGALTGNTNFTLTVYEGAPKVGDSVPLGTSISLETPANAFNANTKIQLKLKTSIPEGRVALGGVLKDGFWFVDRVSEESSMVDIDTSYLTDTTTTLSRGLGDLRHYISIFGVSWLQKTDPQMNLWKYENGNWIAASSISSTGRTALIVHGITDDHTSFTDLAKSLSNPTQGLPYTVYAVQYWLGYGLTHLGRQLASYIVGANVNLQEDFVLIAHSMGGLVSRSALEEHSADVKIKRLITLGSPHNGTSSGFWYKAVVNGGWPKPVAGAIGEIKLVPEMDDLAYGSNFITKLNTNGYSVGRPALFIAGLQPDGHWMYNWKLNSVLKKPNDAVVETWSAWGLKPTDPVSEQYAIDHSLLKAKYSPCKFKSYLYNHEGITKAPFVLYDIEAWLNALSEPTDLSVKARAGNSISLEWRDRSFEEEGFIIWRSSDNNSFSEANRVSANQTTYTDTGLTPNTKYYYRVQGYKGSSYSLYSNTVEATTILVPPLAPAGLSAKASSSNQIVVRWTDTSNETSYRIERSTTGTSGSFGLLDNVGADVTTYTDTISDLPGVKYYYRVIATNSAGSSSPSNVDTATTVAAPTNLVVTGTIATRVDLQWKDNSGNESGFLIERSTSASGTFTQVCAVGTNEETVEEYTVQPNTTYYFRVRAYYTNDASTELDDDHSSYSNVVQATTPPAAVPFYAQKLAAGVLHTVALKGDGTVWAWGHNGCGQLGDGTTSGRSRPVQVNGLGGVTAIAAGGYHTVALKSDGTVWAWGGNGSVQLGDGTTTNRSMPVQVGGLSGVTAITAGGYHTIALKGDGTVWAWGHNGCGQLGDGTTSERSRPIQVNGLGDVTAIAAGVYHTVALKSDGTIWAWGSNGYGQLGDGTTTNRSTPVQVSGLSGVTAITAEGYHTVALEGDGTVWAWGNNSSGQLGDGTTTNRYTPVQISGLSGVIAIAAGAFHTVVLKGDGTVWTWGSNGFGQLGDGTTTRRLTPVQVSGLSGVTAIAAGDQHMVALKGDGTVWAWGYNSSGQLGDGTTTDRYKPVQVILIQ